MRKVVSLILTLVLVLSLVSGLPMTAKAAQSYGLWIGGVEVTSENCEDIKGDKITEGKVSYDDATHTITLEGAVISGGSEESKGAGIYINQNLEYMIKGTGEVKGTSGSDSILYDPTGDGFDASLTIDGASTDIKAESICCPAPFYVKDGTLDVENEYDKGKAINAGEPGGIVEISGGTVIAKSDSFGIYANNGIYISGGTVNATSTKGNGLYCPGTASKIEISGGTVNTNGIQCVRDEDCSVTISDGDVTVANGNPIFAYDLYISGGNITVTNPSERGIRARNDIVISGGNITVNSGKNGIEAENKKIEIKGDARIESKVSSGYLSICSYYNNFSIAEGLCISKPVGGEIGRVGNSDTIVKDSSAANDVVIEPISYPLWIGNKQVTWNNKADVLGDGKVKYDESTGKLTLDEVEIYGDFYKDGEDEVGIYSELENLTIEGSLRTSGASYGIKTNGTNLKLDGTGSDGIQAYGLQEGISADGEKGSLELSGSIVASGDGLTGIYSSNDIVVADHADVSCTGNSDVSSGMKSDKGTITINNALVFATGRKNGITSVNEAASEEGAKGQLIINGGTITAIALGNQSYGLIADSIVISGGRIDAECRGTSGDMSAISTGKNHLGSITYDPDDYVITTPEDGILGENGYDFYEKAGTTVAKHVVLEPEIGTKYNITLAETEHGTATVSRKQAIEGRKIKVTATPDEGYDIDKITYTPEGGSAVDITEEKSFEMPDVDVTVKVTFRRVVSLTIHWSAIDGVDKENPIVVSGLEPGTKVKEVLEDDACDCEFKTEGYNYVYPFYLPKPFTEYTNQTDVNADFDAILKTAINDDMDIYFCMNKLISNAELTITQPKCGDETTTSKAGDIWDSSTQTNRPQMSIPEGKGYKILGMDTPNSSNLWVDYDSYDARTGVADPFVGTFEGDKEYDAYVVLVPEFGYEFNMLDLKINGGKELNTKQTTAEAYIYMSTVALHGDKETVKEKEVAPTCTKNGSYDEVTRYKECGKEISRETVTVDKLGHDWGEWKVTKEATESEEGLEERVCSRCGEKETNVIPKKEPTGDDDPDDKGDKSDDKGDKSDDTPKYKNEWVDGKWYDEFGNCTYEGILSWKQNATGWWIEDTTGWYPTDSWQKIDGKWYYFTADGYMDYSEYRDGCWLGADGAWDENYAGGHWMSDSSGWWYTDNSGWYPKSQWLWIDGVQYYFDASGYMV